LLELVKQFHQHLFYIGWTHAFLQYGIGVRAKISIGQRLLAHDLLIYFERQSEIEPVGSGGGKLLKDARDHKLFLNVQHFPLHHLSHDIVGRVEKFLCQCF